MSEILFAALLLGALAAAIQHRRSRAPLALGAARRSPRRADVLTRANALVLLVPLAFAVWDARPRFSLARAGPAGRARSRRAAVRDAVDDPQRGRLPPVRAGLDPARLGARRHLQHRGDGRQGEPGVVAQPAADRGVQVPDRPVAGDLGGRARAQAARGVDRLHRGAPRLRAQGDLVGHAARARPRVLEVVAAHREHDQRHARLGRRRRRLLLDLRPARAGGRVHRGGAAHAVVGVGDARARLPRRGGDGVRDAPLPDRDRPVRRHARGARRGGRGAPGAAHPHRPSRSALCDRRAVRPNTRW